MEHTFKMVGGKKVPLSSTDKLSLNKSELKLNLQRQKELIQELDALDPEFIKIKARYDEDVYRKITPDQRTLDKMDAMISKKDNIRTKLETLKLKQKELENDTE